MQRRLIFTVAVAVLSLCLGNPDAFAQSDLRKTEVGAQFSVLHFENFDTDLELLKKEFPQKSLRDTVALGFGGRFTFNFNDKVALEAEWNFFPERPSFIFEGRRKQQALFGPKIGIRKEKIGVFGKVRPGFVHFSIFDRVVDVVRFPSGSVLTIGIGSRHNFFALDVGGVLELYPTRRIVVRYDLGDTIIHYRSLSPHELNPAFTRHNLQFNVGFGFRF